MRKRKVEGAYTIVEDFDDITGMLDVRKWYSAFNGEDLLHREDGPAAEFFKVGTMEWYCQGKLHRTDGPAQTFWNGTWAWWHNGQMHREDGPAYCTAAKQLRWYQRGQLHRLDGPAIVYTDGESSWFVRGIKIISWKCLLEHAPELTQDDIIKLRLMYSDDSLGWTWEEIEPWH